MRVCVCVNEERQRKEERDPLHRDAFRSARTTTVVDIALLRCVRKKQRECVYVSVSVYERVWVERERERGGRENGKVAPSINLPPPFAKRSACMHYNKHPRVANTNTNYE